MGAVRRRIDMVRRSIAARLCGAAVLAIVTAGCPDLGDEPMDWSLLDHPVITGNFTGEAPPTADVVMKNISFVPDYVAVQRGGTVTWHNIDSVPHSVNSGLPQAPAGVFDSPLLKQNQIWERTFDEAGLFEYFCAPHANIMYGAIVEVVDVEEP